MSLRQSFLVKGCQAVMHDVLLNDLKEYRHKYDGQYPPDLAAAENFNNPGGKLDFVTCPGVGIRTLPAAGGTNADYIYVNWGLTFGTNDVPGNYPVIYDRRLANHKGLGVNVITMDGRHFFDRHASWLQKFTNSYPQYHLTMPE